MVDRVEWLTGGVKCSYDEKSGDKWVFVVMSFRGVSVCNIDAKSRFAIPTKFREVLKNMAKNTCVVTIDTDEPCLLLYPLPVWEEIENQLQSLPSLNPKVRRIQRLLIGHASESELDSQGRMLLPQILREHADLNKKCMLVGQGKKFEIWSEENWKKGREEWLETGRAMRQGGEDIPDELSSVSI